MQPGAPEARPRTGRREAQITPRSAAAHPWDRWPVGRRTAGRRLFVKTATTPAAHESLGPAIRFHRAVRHPSIVAPIDLVDTEDHRQLTYPWHHGTVLNHATVRGSDRAGLDRFHELDAAEILAAIEAILDAHLAIASAGFVSVDLYDGCFLYDFDAKTMRLIDLDECRPGPFIINDDRLPGSTRYMAPEEFTRDTVIDEQTTVFHLGRTASQLLGAEDLTGTQRQVVETATQPDRDRRHPHVETMVLEWRSTADR